MAKTLDKSGITTNSTVEAWHVTQSIDALTGTENAYDITISGSLTVTGSLMASGSAGSKADFLKLNGGVSGSFSGSFAGDGTNLTGITAEWDGTHVGDAEITGSLVVTQNITGSNISASGHYYGKGGATFSTPASYAANTYRFLIGTGSSTAHPFARSSFPGHIQEKSQLIPNLILEETNAGAAANIGFINPIEGWEIGADADPQGFYFCRVTGSHAMDSDGYGKFFISSSGDIGVGTSSPDMKFHISGSTPNLFKIERDDFQNTNIAFKNSLGTYYAGIDDDGGSPAGGLFWGVGESQDMSVGSILSVSASNVGIGTINPNEKLEVVGNISASGTGSFGHLTMDYDAMPSADPNIKGVIWRSGTDLKISAG